MSVRKNIKQIIKWGILTAILTLMAFSSPLADFKFEFQSAQGYTNNIFQNTDSKDDRNTVERASISYYPLPSLKVDLSGTYTYYGRTVGLSNFAGVIDVTLFPIKEDSPLSLYLNANYKPTIYREAFEKFENSSINVNLGISYLLSNFAQLRGGFTYTSNQYSNDSEIGYDTISSPPAFEVPADHKIYEFFIGSNFTLPACNSLDVELGYSNMSLTYVPEPFDTLQPRDWLNPWMDTLKEGHLGAFYFSPRFSRPLGGKIGMNITYIYRKFVDAEENVEYDAMVIPGLSTQFLSPWTAVYEGNAVTITIKTFLIPHFIISSGLGYWEKDYLKSEKEREEIGYAFVITDRNDDQTKYYLSISRPITLKSGFYFEPAVQIDYSKNKSNNSYYDYDNIAITAGITVRR